MHRRPPLGDPPCRPHGQRSAAPRHVTAAAAPSRARGKPPTRPSGRPIARRPKLANPHGGYGGPASTNYRAQTPELFCALCVNLIGFVGGTIMRKRKLKARDNG